MAIAPAAAIPAAPNRQAAAGLVALGVTPPNVPAGWEAGFVFEAETCDDGLLYSVECVTETEKPVGANEPPAPYQPVLIVGADTCTTLDRSRDREGRARRHLLAVQSFQLERAFWTGEATDDSVADGGLRPHLADGTATEIASGAAVPLPDAAVLLDQAITECLHGQQGMWHVTPAMLVLLAAGDLVERVNGRWLTPNGHIVVAGSGYTGGGPRPGEGQALPQAPDLTASPVADQWAYATPVVQVLLGEIDLHRDVDRGANSETVRAERPAAAFHGCCKFAIQITSSGE